MEQNQIIFRERASAVCFRDERILMVNIFDKVIGKKFWMPPGGGAEGDEDHYQAAERETREETGIIVTAYPESEIIKEYEFKFRDQVFVTRTHFFLVEYVADDPNFNPYKREEEIFAYEWSTLKNAFDRMAPYEEIQTAVYELVYPLLRGKAGADLLNLPSPLSEEIFEDE